VHRDVAINVLPDALRRILFLHRAAEPSVSQRPWHIVAELVDDN
jgi:hypothetical protein